MKESKLGKREKIFNVDRFRSCNNHITGGPEKGDDAPNSRTIPNESGANIDHKCNDKRAWCSAADCSIDIIKLLCPKTCKACNTGMVSIKFSIKDPKTL